MLRCLAVVWLHHCLANTKLTGPLSWELSRRGADVRDNCSHRQGCTKILAQVFCQWPTPPSCFMGVCHPQRPQWTAPPPSPGWQQICQTSCPFAWYCQPGLVKQEADSVAGGENSSYLSTWHLCQNVRPRDIPRAAGLLAKETRRMVEAGACCHRWDNLPKPGNQKPPLPLFIQDHFLHEHWHLSRGGLFPLLISWPIPSQSVIHCFYRNLSVCHVLPAAHNPAADQSIFHFTSLLPKWKWNDFHRKNTEPSLPHLCCFFPQLSKTIWKLWRKKEREQRKNKQGHINIQPITASVMLFQNIILTLWILLLVADLQVVKNSPSVSNLAWQNNKHLSVCLEVPSVLVISLSLGPAEAHFAAPIPED